MDIIGEKFESGEYFVGDLIFAGELLSSSLEKLKPFLGSGGSKEIGVMVLGTVKGDIHDIGKNLFRGMAEAAGIKVIDLGIDQDIDAFVKAVKDNHANIVGLSGVLTLAIDSMKKTIEALDAAGVRKDVKVMIGGNAVNEEACKYVGADYWSKNAADAVKTAVSYL
jgi:methanogenic corrinoid protein MtbC1